MTGKYPAECIVYKTKVTNIEKVRSFMVYRMKNSKLGTATITDMSGTKGTQLILNFLNTSGDNVVIKFNSKLNEILRHMFHLARKVIVTRNEKIV